MRTLGSFNKRVNLPSHPEDRQPVARQQLPSPRFNRVAEDAQNTSNAGKFFNSRGRMRFAGTAIGVDIRNGAPVDQNSFFNQETVNSSGPQPAPNVPNGVGAAERRVS